VRSGRTFPQAAPDVAEAHPAPLEPRASIPEIAHRRIAAFGATVATATLHADMPVGRPLPLLRRAPHRPAAGAVTNARFNGGATCTLDPHSR
jgi:hypothetical protein